MPNVEIQKGRIQDVKRKGAAFVSPANSLGFMDGGVDYTLSREMFPGCEKEVKKKIWELAAQDPEGGHKTLLGRPYLRVGSALWVPCAGGAAGFAEGSVQTEHEACAQSSHEGSVQTEHEACAQSSHEGQTTALISAPTMFLPHPIPHTRNVYWAMQAALVCVQKIKFVNTLVITSMGCGVGCMDPEAAALQIYDAWREYITNTLPPEVEQKGDSYAILASRDAAQPSNYDNREIGIPWPPGWKLAEIYSPTGSVKHINITFSSNRGNSVCYDA